MDALEELRASLARFEPEDLRRHALPLFPEVSWAVVLERLERLREGAGPKAIAGVVVDLVRRSRLPRPLLLERMDTLTLHEYSLSTKRTWSAYKLRGRTVDADAEGAPAVQTIAELVGRALDAPSVAVRAAHDVDSVMIALDRGRPPRRRRTVLCLTGDHLLVSPPSPGRELVEAVAKGLGYRSAEYCRLSGPRLSSLTETLRAGRSASRDPSPPAQTGPRRTSRGLDFAPPPPARDRGDRVPVPLLRVTAKAATSGGRVAYSKVLLRSADAAASLKRMAEAGIIEPSSLFSKMLSQGKNDIRIKIVRDQKKH